MVTTAFYLPLTFLYYLPDLYFRQTYLEFSLVGEGAEVYCSSDYVRCGAGSVCWGSRG